MRRTIILLGLVMLFTGCNKERLDLVNPNQVILESLKSETGFHKGAYGVYYSLRSVETSSGWFYYTWFNQWAHNVMGDVTTSYVGSFGIRWANQTSRIIKPDGTTITPSVGGKQHEELDLRNTREAGSFNVQAFEWFPAYSLIGHCNFMLKAIDDVKFSGNEEVVALKIKTYQAWFYWWKGFAYSRLGSIYKQGLIIDEYNQQVNSFVSNLALLNEAARNFNLAKDILVTIADGNETYNQVFGNLIPSHFKVGSGGIIVPSAFIRNINTYMARNILVSRYAIDLSVADLNEVESLANSGIQATDKIFTIRSASENCLVYTTIWSSYRLNLAWERVSERLIQDFRAGDTRLTRDFTLFSTPIVNPNGRGFQYSTRYAARSVDVGGTHVSYTAGATEVPMACSYEENQLMLAEVKIRKGEIEQGLAHIDAVRNFQGANLDPLVGTGLTQAQALEELRSERRVGLFLKNVAFYDARRWGILKPISHGGGRTNAMVVFDNSGDAVPCTIEYDYKEWWGVPANEADLNPSSAGNGPEPKFTENPL